MSSHMIKSVLESLKHTMRPAKIHDFQYQHQYQDGYNAAIKKFNEEIDQFLNGLEILERLEPVHPAIVALNEINNWLVCACITSPEDMAASFPHMQELAENALKQSGKKS